MKWIIVACSLIIWSVNLMAQTTEVPDTTSGSAISKSADTTVVEIPGFKIIIRESDDDKVDVKVERKKGGSIVFEDEVETTDESNTDLLFDLPKADTTPKPLKNVSTKWLLMELGLNGYLNNQGGFTAPVGYSELALQPAKSVNYNLHLFRQGINLIRHKFQLEYGVKFAFSDYRFEEDVIVVSRAAELTLLPSDEPLKKSKLSTTYLDIPIGFSFATDPASYESSFRVGAGAFAGVLLGARTKYKTTNGKKVKETDRYNLNNFRYGVSGNIGYGWFNLYVNYVMSDFFAENEGPTLNTWEAGIVIVGY